MTSGDYFDPNRLYFVSQTSFQIAKTEMELKSQIEFDLLVDDNLYICTPYKDSLEDTIYVGQCNSNTHCKEGFGIQIMLKQDTKYKGYWKDNKYQGIGITIKKNEYYLGEWESGKKKGYGKYVTEGFIYEGEFYDDKKNGSGTYIDEDGVKIVGVWQDDRRIITFHRTLTNGDKILYQNEEPTTIHYHNKDFYVGGIQKTLFERHGFGTMTYSFQNGSFQGNWKNNQRHGKGTLISVSGTLKEGMWVDDKYQKKFFEKFNFWLRGSFIFSLTYIFLRIFTKLIGNFISDTIQNILK